VTDATVLTLREELDAPVDLSCLATDRLLGLDERAIAALEVWRGRERLTIGDLFDVSGSGKDHVHVEGDLAKASGVGAGMASGYLVVDGNVGDGAGLAMRGGSLVIYGDAGRDAGGAPAAASRGMSGGEIIVHGSAGRDAGARMRRGLLAIVGNAGADAGAESIAGTVMVFGDAGDGSGRGSKRGTLAVVGAVTMPAGYVEACTYRPPHLRLTLVHLARIHNVPVDERWLDGSWRRWSGDMAELGRGEILQWTGQ
jgi:formylmethanofuran dehydrogenase subunit C